jgi:hypothetical protein
MRKNPSKEKCNNSKFFFKNLNLHLHNETKFKKTLKTKSNVNKTQK